MVVLAGGRPGWRQSQMSGVRVFELPDKPKEVAAWHTAEVGFDIASLMMGGDLATDILGSGNDLIWRFGAALRRIFAACLATRCGPVAS
ncbi:hypothetical protein DSL92_05145 [Billgrantia gudaonensis]|uniref:Uncharacterized protein n=1 Tax=Billgrantia gudaonensis TaxID=376427 RepID=A0A3S0QRS8_9GAMM|nr:hypothetical protein DSL92_05145 [Halomonas gudaonensis]